MNSDNLDMARASEPTTVSQLLQRLGERLPQNAPVVGFEVRFLDKRGLVNSIKKDFCN